jgi:hypothetical protein
MSRRDSGEREPYIVAMAFEGCGDLEVRHTYNVRLRQKKKEVKRAKK